MLCGYLFKASSQAAGPGMKCVDRARAGSGFLPCGGGGVAGTEKIDGARHLPGEA